jgi:hypothetical protein
MKMGEKFHFPKFHYYLDESDPDIVILRRQDDSFVAAFSASGATREGFWRPPRKTIGNSSRLIQTILARPPRKTGALNPDTRLIHLKLPSRRVLGNRVSGVRGFPEGSREECAGLRMVA